MGDNQRTIEKTKIPLVRWDTPIDKFGNWLGTYGCAVFYCSEKGHIINPETMVNNEWPYSQGVSPPPQSVSRPVRKDYLELRWWENPQNQLKKAYKARTRHEYPPLLIDDDQVVLRGDVHYVGNEWVLVIVGDMDTGVAKYMLTQMEYVCLAWKRHDEHYVESLWTLTFLGMYTRPYTLTTRAFSNPQSSDTKIYDTTKIITLHNAFRENGIKRRFAFLPWETPIGIVVQMLQTYNMVVFKPEQSADTTFKTYIDNAQETIASEMSGKLIITWSEESEEHFDLTIHRGDDNSTLQILGTCYEFLGWTILFKQGHVPPSFVFVQAVAHAYASKEFYHMVVPSICTIEYFQNADDSGQSIWMLIQEIDWNRYKEFLAVGHALKRCERCNKIVLW